MLACVHFSELYCLVLWPEEESTTIVLKRDVVGTRSVELGEERQVKVGLNQYTGKILAIGMLPGSLNSYNYNYIYIHVHVGDKEQMEHEELKFLDTDKGNTELYLEDVENSKYMYLYKLCTARNYCLLLQGHHQQRKRKQTKKVHVKKKKQ